MNKSGQRHKREEDHPAQDLQVKGSAGLDIGAAVLKIRQEKGLSGAELCRRTRNLDPKTLTAVEKGRIRNPSIATLQALAEGFGSTVSDIFRQAEVLDERYFRFGTQKGFYKMDFSARGLQVVSFTPVSGDFFCGKVILEGEKSLDDSLFARPGVFFVMVIVGHVEGEVDGKKFSLREGENLYFYGGLRFYFQNPAQRSASLFLVTVPSCISAARSFSKL